MIANADDGGNERSRSSEATGVLGTKVVSLRAVAGGAAECANCAVRLRDKLLGYRGIEVAHINSENDSLILHYDPALTSLATVEAVVKQEGLRLEARYHHMLFRVVGLHSPEDALELERRIASLEGVIWAEANYASATMKLEYDSALVDESAIVAQARRLGYELQPESAQVLKLRVTGMDCPDCAVHLQEGLRRLPGVAFASADFAAGTVTIVPKGGKNGPNADGEASSVGLDELLAQARRTVEAAGYSVEGEVEGERERGNLLLETVREEWPLAATAALLLVGVGLHLAGLALPADIAFLIAVVVGGYRVALAGVRTLISARSLNIDVLMTIAVIGAVAMGQLSEAAVVVFLYALGEAMEGYTMDRARQAIRQLMDLTPRQATRLRDGLEERVPVSSLATGDIVLVSPGESLPVDGVIVSGQSTLNEATVTGESLPVPKGEGDEVFAGTVNGMAALKVRATRPASDSTVARIVRMVEEAQSRRAPSQRLVERFARYYTPAVVVLAVIVAVLPPLLGLGAWRTWIGRSLVLLVISCPCALVISTPVAVVSAIARAARRGVILKGGAYLEELGRVRVVALDKTGTLTSGRPAVQSVVPIDGLDRDQLLGLAAAIEARSSHPLAAALTREAAKAGLASTYEVSEVQEVPGKGVHALVDGEPHCAGRADFVLATCAVQDDGELAPLRQLEERGETAVAVARSGRLLGFVGLQDSLRPEALSAVEATRNLGVRVLMLTGDNERTAAAIARQAGVDEFRAGLRPEDKRDAVLELRERYGSVAMVGDGVNDAPALAASSVGIAMGAAGSHAALETADVVLMADDLAKLPGTLRLGRHTRIIIATNVAFAVLVKLTFLGLAAAGMATLWMAVFADVGATMIVILNAMRLFRERV